MAGVVAVVGLLVGGALVLAYIGDRRRASRPVPPSTTMKERRRQLRASRTRWF
jgi:hypothetical protein